jgi:hypothetical protein
MKELFIPKVFRGDHPQIIETANTICRDYRRQGYNLTLRQLYYQFVANHGMKNNDRNYKRLGGIINDARLAGELDWSYIQDRTRTIRGGFNGWDDPGEFIKTVVEQYTESLWVNQEYRPEVWVEKDALVGVIGRACGRDRVPYFSCRGYVSQSAMYDAAKRIENRRARGLTPVIIHLGDHDPSGIDMTRDIQDRLQLMSLGSVEVRRIALSMDQIREYDPPPNPAKLTDSRGSSYVELYGTESWELDALEPSVLENLIIDTLEDYIDRELMEEAREHEESVRSEMAQVGDRWDDLRAHWSEIESIIGVAE